MPFDEEEAKPSVHAQKIGLKKSNVSTQKSVFESMPKKPTPQEFEQQVKRVQDQEFSYKTRAAELAMQFNRSMQDKTLVSLKNVLQQDVERELLTKMVRLAQEVNNDQNEREGEGSLSWIILLLKTCFSQRDRINSLEYEISVLKRLTSPAAFSAAISKEIQALDKSKKSE